MGSKRTLFDHFRYEPALILYGINALVAVAVSFGLNLSSVQTAAVTTIATAVLGLVTAAVTRPVNVGAITAAFSAGLVALGAFGLHLAPNSIGALTAFISVALSMALRAHVSPATGAGTSPAPVNRRQ